VDNFVESDRENPEKARRYRRFWGCLKLWQSKKSFKINDINHFIFVKRATQKNLFFRARCVYRQAKAGRKASESLVGIA
jgi:hypothetical protein